MNIFENSEDSCQEDDVDESVPSKQEAVSLLLQAITQYYISQHLTTLSKTATIDSSIFLTSFLSLVKQYPDSNNHEGCSNDILDLTLQQWNFRKISVPGDHNLVDRVKDNDEAVICSLRRLGVLSNTQNELEVSSLAKVLCLLVAQEWLGENSEYYQGFVTTDIETHAHQYLNSGEFGGDLGDLMVVTLSNILHIPITIFSNIPGLGLVCITPTSGVNSIIPL